MKSIKKITKTVAGSALLVGATLAGASAMGAAQDSGSSGTLSDYPAPFVDEDGTVDGTTVVVGESARTADVVGATNIAAGLGQAAFTSESVSAEGGNFGWSATNGVTLDTRNDNLYFGDSLNTVRETLTEENLEILSESTFTDDDNEETDVTNYLDIGSQSISFGTTDGELDDEDPAVHVAVPSEGSVSADNYLVNLQANFEESIDFASDPVAGEEMELFGTTYTIAEDNVGGESDELILYGSQETTSISTDEEAQTITVDGQEVTLSVTAVTGSNTAAVEVDGELEEYNEDESFTVNNQEVRVDNIIQTSTDQSAGTVTFAVGSQEIVLQDGDSIQDSDGDDIEGTHVEFNGGEADGMTGIDLYLGAQDDDEDALVAGETFSHEAVPGVEVHFGGMNPDTMEEGAEVQVTTSGDDTASLDVPTGSDSSTSFGFSHGEGDDSTVNDQTDLTLADSDNDMYNMIEGQAVDEDGYFATDAGDFSHMWEVTSIDAPSDEEATVDISDVVSGDSRELELPQVDAGATHADEEIIDGQTYHFWLDSSENLHVTWGDNADFGDQGDALSAFPALDAPTGHAFTFTSEQTLPDFATQTEEVLRDTGSSFTADDGTSSVRLTANLTGDTGVIEMYDGNGDSLGTVDLAADETTWQDTGLDSGETVQEIRVRGSPVDNGFSGSVEFSDSAADDSPSSEQQFTSLSSYGGDGSVTVELPSTESTDAKTNEVTLNGDDSTHDFTVGQIGYTLDEEGSNTADTLALQQTNHPSAVVMHPENDDDNEEAYVVTPGYDDDDEEVTVTSNPFYTGMTNGQANYNTVTLESDDNINAAMDHYGSYSEVDDDGQGSFTLNVANGQAVAGAAVTGADGSLSAGGSAGSVTSMMPTYNGEGFPAGDFVALDSENPSQLKQNDLILVGGPSVNNLVSELASANQTWSASEYEEGDQLVQMVENAFTEGQDALVVAGYDASDTRDAAQAVANWKESDFSGQSQVNLATQ